MALERARPSVFHSARSREEFECDFVDKMDLRKGRTAKYINEPMDCRRIVVRKGDDRIHVFVMVATQGDLLRDQAGAR